MPQTGSRKHRRRRAELSAQLGALQSEQQSTGLPADVEQPAQAWQVCERVSCCLRSAGLTSDPGLCHAQLQIPEGPVVRPDAMLLVPPAKPLALTDLARVCRLSPRCKPSRWQALLCWSPGPLLAAQASSALRASASIVRAKSWLHLPHAHGLKPVYAHRQQDPGPSERGEGSHTVSSPDTGRWPLCCIGKL